MAEDPDTEQLRTPLGLPSTGQGVPLVTSLGSVDFSDRLVSSTYLLALSDGFVFSTFLMDPSDGLVCRNNLWVGLRDSVATGFPRGQSKSQ